MSKRPHAPRQKNQKAVNVKDNAHREGERLLGSIPARSPTNPSEADDKGNRSMKWWPFARPVWVGRVWEWTHSGWKLTLDTISTVALIFYAAITFVQWSDLRKNFTISERAWVQVKSKDPSRSLADIVYLGIPMEVVNVGKTPAIRITIQMKAEVLSRDAEPSFSYDGAVTFTGVLWQNVVLDIPGGDPMARLTDAQRESLKAGSYLATWGTVNFRDVFGGEHWTKYCTWRTFGPGVVHAGICANYNDTDAR